MASLSTERSKKTGKVTGRRIQFVNGDRERKSIRLGLMPAKDAENILAKVEELNALNISGTSWGAELARWVAQRPATLYDKLASVGLVPKRAEVEKAKLGPFLEAYISGRSDVKGGTATVYGHARRCLIGYFGADKPLSAISAGDADDWRLWLASDQGLAENTVRRRCGIARQFFRAAVRKKLLADNPFGDMKGVAVRANRSRDFFLSRDDAEKVLDACPDAEWRLIVALSRFGGLRCPSEHLALRWADVDWAANRLTVTSPKTEHHDGKETRVMPLFAELRPHLEAAFDPEAVYVINRYRDARQNLRTQFERIIRRAGLSPWPKLFANLRATRETELAELYPLHVVCEWIGHSQAVAAKHYLQVTDEHFGKAAAPAEGPVQNPAQSASGTPRNETSDSKAPLAIPVNHEGLPCYTSVHVSLSGLEPETYGLKVRCSTD